MQIAQSMQLEHRRVRGSRSVERELVLDRAHRCVVFCLGGPGHDHRRPDQFDLFDGSTHRCGALGDGRLHDLFEGPTAVERMHDQAVGDLACGPDHPRSEATEEHRWGTERIGPGVERRHHQRVPVELAVEGQLAVALPTVPDGSNGEHQLPHTRRRARPGLAEALLDVGSDLRAEAQHEAATRDALQVRADVREHHRVACERDRDGRPEAQVRGGARRQCQGKERVVLRLERETRVVAGGLEVREEPARAGGILGRHGGGDAHLTTLAPGRSPPDVSAPVI